MPGKIKVKVLAGRNLPVMDRASDTTDAFVEIKFGSVTHKTDVCRKSLNPHWSSTEWYRFEVDESELQDEPLQLRLMDHDTYSANDAIGKVVISLAPLLARVANTKGGAAAPHGAMMSGWIPVFDTMHGIRGELNVIVKVELFSDFNKYKTSSCGVQFFHCPMIPPGYKVTAIHGFVEELVVNDDPEYQWIDKIRTPRASNEARQVAFIKLSNQVQRLVGLKAAELGANAVVGYQQDFDLEGEAGVVARAIGTAVSITAQPMSNQPPSMPPCSQQQLNKYLDILATDHESTTDLNEYFQTHQDELQKLLYILNPKTSSMLDETENFEEEELSRQSIKSYTGNYSIYQHEYGPHDSMRHLSEDQTDLYRLLNRNDDDNDSMGPLKKIKQLKTSIFRLGSTKSRKSDQADDAISIQSNVSDTSKISLSDIKLEFKKLKRLKKPKLRKAFANKSDEGIGMASVLARSVIHAHTSLACITESQDSEASPSSTLRRTSESEPNINLSDEEQAKKDGESYDSESIESEKKNLPAIKFSSLKNISTEEEIEHTEGRQRKLSESCPSTPVAVRKNLLKLPGEDGYFGSTYSGLSGDSSEAYTSSEEDDENSMKTDPEKLYETTSSVVKSVLNNPAFIAQMDKKLSVLECNTPDLQDIKNQQAIEEDVSHKKTTQEIYGEGAEHEVGGSNDTKTDVQTLEVNVPEASTSTGKAEHMFVEPKSHNLHFKFHNPFSHKKPSQSISAPSSPVEKKGFVYRSSNKIKRQLSKISKSSMIKSLSHYSLLPKRKHSDPKPLSQPSSASDVPSKAPSETVLGSAFLSYSDLLSLDKEGMDANNRLHKSDEFAHSKVSMYIGSEPVSRASVSGPSSPYHGKDDYHPHEHRSLKKRPSINPSGLVATAMETILIDKVQNLLVPTSPSPLPNNEKKFFDDVNEKLEKVEEARIRKESENDNHKVSETTSVHIKKDVKQNRNSLIATAMETILIDKVQSLLVPTSPSQTQNNENIFFGGSNENFEQEDKARTRRESETEKQKISGAISKNDPVHKAKDVKHNHSSLIATAMETILIDKVQSLLVPTSPSQTQNNENIFFGDSNETFEQEDKARIRRESETEKKKISGAISKNDPVHKAKDVKHNHSSLIATAMETILIDKVQSLLAPTSPSQQNNENKLFDDVNKKIENLEEARIKNETGNDVQKTSDTMTSLSNDKDGNILKTMAQNIPETMSQETVHAGDSQKEEQNISASKVQTKQSKKENVELTDSNHKKLVKQDSIFSDESHKMSNETKPNIVSSVPHAPMLQHFHPLLSGAPKLATIPSLPETSIDQTESIDIDGTCLCNDKCECSDTNQASVCDNSHAACGVDREREREKDREKDKGSPRHARHESYGNRDGMGSAHAPNSSLEAASTPLGIHRRSSDSDLSVTPKGGSLNASVGNTGSGGGAILRPSMNSNNLEMLEYPFLTMSEYPPGFIVHIGGTVCARSVKLMDGGGESSSRAAWWAELRTELRAHARALRCNAVIAYTETAAICEDVCVLSASGTAAVIDLDCGWEARDEADSCSLAHVPYSPGAGPYRAELSICGGCRRARVPAVLLATCAKPASLASYSAAVPLTAVAARARRAPPQAEPGARDISDQLPFLEYELHKLLLAKLRMQGANALFSLQTQVAVGERCVMAIASGTAVRICALPPPTPPRIKATENDKEALEIQKALWDAFTANKAANGYDVVLPELTNGALAEADSERGDEAPVLDLCADKDACVLELDEAEDVETAKVLAKRRPHMQVFTSGSKALPGVPPHAFAQVWRARLALSGQSGGASTAGERHVARALDGVAYKLRRLRPCALLAPRIQLELPEDEIQLVVSGAAIRLIDPSKVEHSENGQGSSNSGTVEDDDIFTLDEDQLVKSQEEEKPVVVVNGQAPTTVSLTSLCYCAGAGSVRRVCALRLLFVRETTAVRELGGLSGFLHTFTCEVLAIARAYTAALGGNALTSFYITQLMLQDNAHKNQGQCLLSVGGDVVHMTF